MKLPGQLDHLLRLPPLTRTRIVLALVVALVADGLQLGLGFFGWFGADQVIDVVAMVLTSWLIGFHWLLLPTFALEFLPLMQALPTWTACVSAVIVLRRRQHLAPPKLPALVDTSDRTTAPTIKGEGEGI